MNSRAGFAGDLQALSVAELIQTLALGGRTARVTLTRGARSGELWFDAGALVHAEAAPLYGEPAAYAMLAWTSGSFSVTYGLKSESRSVEQDATYVVLEGLRRIDEGAQPAPAEPAAAPGVRSRPRRPILQILGTAGALAVVGIVLVVTSGEGVSTPAAGETGMAATATPTAPPPPLEPAPSAPVPVPSAPKSKATVPPPAPAPPIEVRQEPEPSLAVVEAEPPPEPVSVERPPPPPASVLRVRVKSGVVGGSLAILVDGTEVASRPLERKREEFLLEVPVPPGDHEIVARVVDPERAGASEKAVRGTFVADAGQTLRITAGRRFGTPVKVKLTEGSGDDDGE